MTTRTHIFIADVAKKYGIDVKDLYYLYDSIEKCPRCSTPECSIYISTIKTKEGYECKNCGLCIEEWCIRCGCYMLEEGNTMCLDCRKWM